MNPSLWYELTFGLDPKYTYVTLLLLSIAGPFLLSFDKKVAFYQDWKYIALPTFWVSLAYILWDIAFTQIGVWKFNRAYLLDIFLSNLPLEEYGFFIVVPYASAFVYACLKAYFPLIPHRYNRIASSSIIALSVMMLVIAPFKWYTSTTFLLLIISIFYWEFIRTSNIHQYLYLAWIVCILPMSYVNGVLTGKPVLIYNDLDNCQFRLGTIPFEDFFYHLLYMIWMINGYHRQKTKANAQ